MFTTIFNVLTKSIDVFLKLRKSDKKRWCSRLIQALFLLDKFCEELQRFHDLLEYYINTPDPKVEKVVKDLEKMRLHPLSEHLRLPWVAIKSHYVIKDEKLGPSGLCLKYAEREDGIGEEFDDEKWKPGETPPAKGIIVMDQHSSSLSELVRDGSHQSLSAKEYLVYLLNQRLRRLVDALRDLIEGWSKRLGVWEDLLDMPQTKLLILDDDLYKTLLNALRIEGQYYRNMFLHCQANIDVQSNRFTLRDAFFDESDHIEIDLTDKVKAGAFLKDTAYRLEELKKCSNALRGFIRDTFEMEDIIGA